jgi:hypothetical protein
MGRVCVLAALASVAGAGATDLAVGEYPPGAIQSVRNVDTRVVPAASQPLRLVVRVLAVGEQPMAADAHALHEALTGSALTSRANRVALEWTPASSTLGIERSGVGLSLDAGYRLSLKVRHRGPTIYLRRQF